MPRRRACFLRARYSLYKYLPIRCKAALFVKWSGPIRRGRQVRYLHLVESYGDAGAHCHRLVANLGELAQPQLDVLVRNFNRLLEAPYALVRHARRPARRPAPPRKPRQSPLQLRQEYATLAVLAAA